MESVIAQEGSGRLAPKVVHIEKATAEQKPDSSASSILPNPVWVIITADVGANGPTKDDLFAGTKEPITLGSEDISLEYTLVNDDSWMETLPWFSRVDNPATKKTGEPVEGEGTELVALSVMHVAFFASLLCWPVSFFLLISYWEIPKSMFGIMRGAIGTYTKILWMEHSHWTQPLWCSQWWKPLFY